MASRRRTGDAHGARVPGGRATPATIALTRAHVSFAVHAYAHDPQASSYGAEAAALLGVSPARVLKTLVATVEGPGGRPGGAAGTLVVAVVPVAARLDLRALAASVGGRRASMAEPASAERATGYVVGGISPLGQKRTLTTVVDATALAHPTVFVSAGRRGVEVELDPHELVRLTGAVTAPIGRG